MKNARIYVFGDSLTYGAWDSHGGWCDRLKRKLHQLKIRLNHNIKFQMFNLGIGGENSRSLLERFESELISRYREDWPAVIIIATGANDTRYTKNDKDSAISIEEFRKNLEEIIRIAKKYSNKILFVGISPVANECQPFKKTIFSKELLKKYDDEVKIICQKHKLHKVEVWEEFESTPKQLFSIDGVHLNDVGHQIIENLVWIELQKILSYEN